MMRRAERGSVVGGQNDGKRKRVDVDAGCKGGICG